MKTLVKAIAFVAIITGSMLTGCTKKDQTEEMQNRVREAELELHEAQSDYEVFKAEADAQIEANERRIEDLKKESKEMKRELKADYDARVEALEEKNKTMKDKLRNAKERGGDRWEGFKKEFKHDMEEFGDAFKDIGKNNVK